jgi:hypothetical protein
MKCKNSYLAARVCHILWYLPFKSKFRKQDKNHRMVGRNKRSRIAPHKNSTSGGIRSAIPPYAGCNIGVKSHKITLKLFFLAAARCLLYDPA